MTSIDVSRWVEPLYLDASVLVKLFVPQPDSDALNAAMRGARDVVLSDLALTEMASALGRRACDGALTTLETRRLYREAVKLAGVCRRLELTPPIHRRAERLLLTLPAPLRALDALHLASAIDAQVATVVTLDARLRDAAASQGLFVAPAA